MARGEIADSSTGLEGGRGDEIGAMARAVAVFRDTAVERDRLEEDARGERQKELRRQLDLRDLIEQFRGLIGEIVSAVSREAAEMSGTAENLTQAALRADQAGGEAREEASGSSRNVQTISAAAVQLSASLEEVSAQMRNASQKVGQAADAARDTDARVGGLVELAGRIGAIVDAIRTIARQTNMLALNATIEAARAGDAGKGFAVVASEVKTLAEHTSRATDEVAAQVGAIQQATRQAVEDIRRIAGAVDEIDRLTDAVSGAVDQQNEATEEIARAISAASNSSVRSTESVGRMAGIITETNREASRVAGATGLLSASSRKLHSAVEDFLRAMSQDVHDRRVALRKASTQGVMIFDNGASLRARLIDVSDMGAKVVAPEILREGQNVVIEFEDKAQSRAKVVWLRDGFAGLQFDRPLGATRTEKYAA